VDGVLPIRMSLGHPLELIQMIKETEDFFTRIIERANINIEKIAPPYFI